MTDDKQDHNAATPLDEVRLSLQEILRILKQDSGGYESQRSRIRELAQRCLEALERR